MNKQGGWHGQNARGSFLHGLNKEKLEAAIRVNQEHMDPRSAELREEGNLGHPKWREWYEDRRIPACRDKPVDEALTMMAKSVVTDSDYDDN